MKSQGFPPIAGPRAKVLVLGTLPGQPSLAAGEYYAHPRNGFWRIIGDLFEVPLDLPYPDRTRRLASSGVAVWDVCEAAHRPGSLDTAIHSASVVANDFESFLEKHRELRLICFNGAKAAELYRKSVFPKLPESLQSIRCETLPSTSPANASIPYATKLSRWSIVKEACEK